MKYQAYDTSLRPVRFIYSYIDFTHACCVTHILLLAVPEGRLKIKYMEKNYQGGSCEPEKVCPAVAYRLINVGVPVTVTPLVITGRPSVKCFGRPSVAIGGPFCSNDRATACSFIISQQVCVGIPVTIGAAVCNDEPFVDCGAGEAVNSKCSCC